MTPLLLVMALQAHAADVLVPAFTPRMMGDFSESEAVYRAVLKAVEGRRLDVVDEVEIRDVAGAAADACADSDLCPDNLWGRFDARMAIVGEVTSAGGSTKIIVRFYGHNSRAPVETLVDELVPGREAAFADRIADIAQEILVGIPPREDVRPAVTQPVAAPVEPKPAEPPPPPQTTTVVVQAAQPAIDPVIANEIERQSMSVPPSTFARYKASGMERQDWLDFYRVRSRRPYVELAMGGAFGDLDRHHDVRVAIDTSGSVNDIYTYDAFLNSKGFEIMVAGGYSPAWWFETGVAMGLELTHQELTAGWEKYEGDTLVDQETRDFGSASSALFVIEPRFRGYVLPAGPIKPYGMTGIQLRAFSGIDVPPATVLSYPRAVGGMSFGVQIGGGVAIDATENLSVFMEAPWTFLLTPNPGSSGGTSISTVPWQPKGVMQLVVFRLGCGWHF